MSEVQGNMPRFVAVRSRVFDHENDQYVQCDNAVTAQLAAQQMNDAPRQALVFPWEGFRA